MQRQEYIQDHDYFFQVPLMGDDEPYGHREEEAMEVVGYRVKCAYPSCVDEVYYATLFGDDAEVARSIAVRRGGEHIKMQVGLAGTVGHSIQIIPVHKK